MATEIEYKFTINKKIFMEEEEEKFKVLRSRQGYFTVKEDSVSSCRIALLDHYYPKKWSDAVFNIKGKRVGASRTEVETKLPYEEGEQLFNMTVDRVEKVRYKVPAVVKGFSGLFWEVDIYEGANYPLAVAELEVPTERATKFEVPQWIVKDVTEDDRYYNANLAKNPYEKWRKAKWTL